MPPRAKITKEMVIDAAFEVIRTEGVEHVNARTVSGKLGCSTQPVMYHFATMEELKQAVYEKTNAYHTEYLMNISEAKKEVMLGIGLNYIHFAVEESNLFRFLFQSGFAAENSLLEMVNSEGITPLLAVMQEAMHMDMEQTKEVFITLALFVHGYASILAGNSLEYDETLIVAHLERVYRGAVFVIQEEKK